MRTTPITIALLAALPFSSLTKPETAPDGEASRQFEHGVQLHYSGKDPAGAIRVFRARHASSRKPLVNSSTAYVAELVAAALQDQGRAKIIGRRTFGRGVVRTFYDIPGGAVIMAPLSNLIRSAGMRLERDHDMTDKDSWGVTPDLVVPPVESPDATRKDSANIRAPEHNLQRHWDATPPDKRDAALKEDVQYRAAIEYLKAVLAKK